MKRFLDDFIQGSTPMFYNIVMVGFSAALALALPMALRFMVRQFQFRWSWIGEVRREKMNGAKIEGVTNTDLADRTPRSIRERGK